MPRDGVWRKESEEGDDINMTALELSLIRSRPQTQSAMG